MRLTLTLTSFNFILFISSCSKDVATVTTAYQIEGFAQKGPFITGSKISVSELNTNLTETGKKFISSITDDKGSFNVKYQGLTYNFISVNSSGIYFDEITGALSSSNLILNAIADISSNQKINVNVLTHLETERIKYLISKGTAFAQAKLQAEKEILKIFAIDNTTRGFEMLDISQAGNDNASLLAISTILEGGHSVSQLTDLLSKISLDIKPDGVLDSDSLKSELINEAQLLDQVKVRQNITDRYTYLGVPATIGTFESIIENFKTKSGYTYTKKITYPINGSNGKPNLLAMSDSIFDTTNSVVLSLTAKLPVGTSLNIVIRADSNTNSTINFNSKNYGGWSYSTVRTTAQTIITSSSSDGEIIIDPRTTNNSITSFTVEIYENGVIVPNKKIKVKVSDLSKAFTINTTGKNGLNFLNSTNLIPNTKGDFSIQISVNDTKAHTVTIVFDYITPAQNSINFSNLEGWAVFNEVLSGQKYLYRSTLILPPSKNNGDARLNISGFGQMSLTGTVDGTTKNAFTKLYEWQ